MGLFSRVPPHVYDQHVLRLERLLLPRAVPPLAHKVLLVRPDVVAVQVLHELVLSAELAVAADPVTMGLDEVGLVLGAVHGVGAVLVVRVQAEGDAATWNVSCGVRLKENLRIGKKINTYFGFVLLSNC